MGKGQIDLEQLVTHELPIDKWEEAFKLVETKEAMKVVMTPID
jgi:alcohol dehydrogenase/L-iditol 2-dehydrogenase